MQGESHDIEHEFPECHEKLQALKAQDTTFNYLVREHDNLDRNIRILEERQAPISDTEIERLKLKRVAYKDRIFHQLMQA